MTRNLLLISGAVPGSEGGRVIVRPSVEVCFTGCVASGSMPNKVAGCLPRDAGGKGASKSEKK